MIELKEPPKNMISYVKAPMRPLLDEFVINLRGLIKQGTANLEIEECSFAIIKDLEKLITENAYVVQFVQIPEKTAHAHFYLKKFNDSN